MVNGANFLKPQTANLVTFTEGILNGKLHFFCAVILNQRSQNFSDQLIKEVKIKLKYLPLH